MITLSHDSPAKSANHKLRANPALDPYRALLHRLRSVERDADNGPQTIGVTSCARGEGTSTVAANLAVAAAVAAAKPVLLVDLNAAHPSQARIFRATSPRTAARAGMTDGAQPTSVENLLLLVPGPAHANGEERSPAWDHAALRELLQNSHDEYDTIVVDLPAVAESGPSLLAAGMLSGVLLVLEAERTRYEVASRALARLTQAHAKVLGVVLNKRPQHIPEWLYKRI